MMTYQARVFALLRAVSARQWITEDDISCLGSLVKWIDATGDGPNVDGRALILSDLGKLVLVEHLRVEYWKAANSDYTAEHGETVGTLEDAQREAVAHARRLGVIGEKDEVTE